MPGALPPGPANALNAKTFAYLKTVLVDGDESGPCPPEVAAALCGFIAGQRVRVGMDVHGLSMEQATSQVLAWVNEQAAHYASLTTEGMN